MNVIHAIIQRAPQQTHYFIKLNSDYVMRFILFFEMTTTTKSISSTQTSKRLGLRQATVWYFMQKVRKAMKSSGQFPLSNIVHVDEFVVGGKEEGKLGRSYDSKKKKAVIAVELSDKKKVRRVYIKSIDDYSAKSLTPIFEQHIDTSVAIFTDKWKGYEPLRKLYKIEQKYSCQGKNFKELHTIVMQIKSWLRAIPTHVSKWHIQAYFDEFCYRLNRSIFKETIFYKTIERMINSKPITHLEIKQVLSV